MRICCIWRLAVTSTETRVVCLARWLRQIFIRTGLVAGFKQEQRLGRGLRQGRLQLQQAEGL